MEWDIVYGQKWETHSPNAPQEPSAPNSGVSLIPVAPKPSWPQEGLQHLSHPRTM